MFVTHEDESSLPIHELIVCLSRIACPDFFQATQLSEVWLDCNELADLSGPWENLQVLHVIRLGSNRLRRLPHNFGQVRSAMLSRARVAWLIGAGNGLCSCYLASRWYPGVLSFLPPEVTHVACVWALQREMLTRQPARFPSCVALKLHVLPVSAMFVSSSIVFAGF